AWLLPSLWNPHQNASQAQNVQIQIAMTSGTWTAKTTVPSVTTASIVASPTPISMVVNATTFSTSPSGVTSVVGNPPAGITPSPDGYYGFHASPTPAAVASPPDNNLATAYPDFGATGCTFELQVNVGGTCKTYQRCNACAQPTPGPL